MIINAECGKPLVIGIGGEDMVTAVRFDISAWVEAYGEGTAALIHRRAGDSTATPVPVTLADGVVMWEITDADTAYQGVGEAQLIYTPTGKTKKSMIFRTVVDRSLTSPAEIPIPMQGWVEQVIQTAADADASAAAAEASAEDAAESARGAELSRIAADGSAGSAARSAADANGYRAAAANSASLASEAQAVAEFAKIAAQAAQEGAETAQGKAEDAQEAAETAQSAAETAQTAAETAQTAAETAQSGAETAAASVSASAAQITRNASDISNLNSTILPLFDNETFDFSSATKSRWTITANGEWLQASTSGASRAYIIPIPQNVEVVKVTGSENNSIYALLKTFSPVSGETADFSDGYTGRVVLQAEESVMLTRASDMAYLYALATTTAGLDMTPTVVFMSANVDPSLAESNVPAEAAATGNAISALSSLIGTVHIPSAYRRVQYLESSGTQFIQARAGTHTQNNNSRMVITFAVSQSALGDTIQLCGSRNTTTSSAFYLHVGTSGFIGGGYNNGTIPSDVIVEADRIYTVDLNKNKLYVDGILKLTATEATFTTPANSGVFAIKTASTNYIGTSKIYHYSEYDNGVLVADLYPAKRVSDDVLGMYDVVNNVFRTNAGTGTFAAGEEFSIQKEIERTQKDLKDLSENTATRKDIWTLNTEINALHGLYDYGYETPYHRDANPSDSGAGKLGADRQDMIVTLNGTLDYSETSATRVKINNAVRISNDSATIKAWSGATEFPEGRTYRITMKGISGSAAPEPPYIAVYKSGESTTSAEGQRIDGNNYRATFTSDGSAYHLCLACAKGKSFSNYKMMIYMEDITDEGNGKAYIQQEADRVSALVRNVQTGNSLTFIACSDLHYAVAVGSSEEDVPLNTIVPALEDLRDGIKAVAAQTHVDFYACFGDVIYQWQGHGANYNNGVKEMTGVTKLLNDAFGIAPQIRMVGNHDPNCENSTTEFDAWLLNSYTGIYSDMLIKDENYSYGGYGYHDFDRQKVRMIVLNTSFYEKGQDIANGGTRYYVGHDQAFWLCHALDLSEKDDAAEWQIVICSHVVLDITGQADIRKYTAVLGAYVNGGTWSETGYSDTYDFSGKNAAELALYFNGHAHTFNVRNLRRMNGSAVQFILPMANIYVPNGLPGREGASFSGTDYEETYTKTANSATSTAFQVITIDFDNKIAYAHHYGAGVDIILHYAPTTNDEFSPTAGWDAPLWLSRDETIATVEDGTVTPVANGYAIICAKNDDENCIEAWNFHSVV